MVVDGNLASSKEMPTNLDDLARVHVVMGSRHLPKDQETPRWEHLSGAEHSDVVMFDPKEIGDPIERTAS